MSTESSEKNNAKRARMVLVFKAVALIFINLEGAYTAYHDTLNTYSSFSGD